MPPYLDRPEARLEEAVDSVELPYGITAVGIVNAINDMYAYLHALNNASVEHGYSRLDDMMQPAGFSGLLSNVFVRSLARAFGSSTPGLAINQWGRGRPDLVPRAVYPNDAVLRGDQGIEVKVSGYGSGWQGHNPETGWICIVQVAIDRIAEPVYERLPTIVDRVMIANLVESDWTFSGRSATSRRTPTASINGDGYRKLEQGGVYVRAGFSTVRVVRRRSVRRRQTPRAPTP